MRIAVHHLTRMQPGYICVAGLDEASGNHVRPCLAGARLRTSLLRERGGPFDVAALVDLGAVRHVGQAPEIEDYLFEPRHARRVADLSAAEFWHRLVAASAASLGDVFGEELKMRGAGRCGVDEGKGTVSLGCIKPSRRPSLRVQSRPGGGDQIRMHLNDGRFDVDVPVTDIRLYGADHVTPAVERVEKLDARLQGGITVVLAVGLSRPYASSPSLPPVHWLQINGVHLEDNPVWQLR
jgi:hypothetical protein